MGIHLLPSLSDDSVAVNSICQRQLVVAVSALAEAAGARNAPLNLGLVLDQSGSMAGQPLETVKQAAQRLVDRLQPQDRLSVIVFDETARVLVANQPVSDPLALKARLSQLHPERGTAIDVGLQLGLETLQVGRGGSISQLFLLTDGDNEHGNNQRCQQLAQQAARDNITINTLGFGYHWNSDLLEQIADIARGSLRFIEFPADAVKVFEQLFNQVVSVGFTNAHLRLQLSPQVRLADLKPVAQVAPDVIELPLQLDPLGVRLGDLLVDRPRSILLNLYLPPLPVGTHRIAQLQVSYDDPAQQHQGLLSPPVPVSVTVTAHPQPNPNSHVAQQILSLARYRQTQIAETRLKAGDHAGAARILQLAADIARELGDVDGAAILQSSATSLQSGKVLTASQRQQTRITAKSGYGRTEATTSG